MSAADLNFWPAEECKTYKNYHRRMKKYLAVVIVVGIILVAAAAVFFSPAFLNRPGFAPDAEKGKPEPNEIYGYSLINANKDCSFSLCGLPANVGTEVYFFLTNEKDSRSYIRGELLTEEGKILGETGVIRPGEYLPSLVLNEELEEPETKVKLKIISYAPGTWQSRGTVSLKLILYKGFCEEPDGPQG